MMGRDQDVLLMHASRRGRHWVIVAMKEDVGMQLAHMHGICGLQAGAQ